MRDGTVPLARPGGTGDRARLSDLNRRLSSPAVIRRAAPCVFLAALLIYLLPLAARGELGAPPERGDGPEYDMVALQLSRGEGFAVDWDDPGFLAPYLAHNESGAYDFLLERHGAGPTAYRPPLLPLLMSASYRILGRDFAPLRVLLGACMALAGTLAFVFVARRFGVLPGALAALLFVVFDPRSRIYATLILTEALVCPLVAALAWCLLQAIEKADGRRAGLLGVCAGILFLARPVVLFWIPLLALAVLTFAGRGTAGGSRFRSLRLAALFVAAFLVVAAPWMVRNCRVLGAFQPLGTMGTMTLAAAYSDEAIARHGAWFSLVRAGFYDALPLADKSPLEQEKMKAEHSRSTAVRWLGNNAAKVPLLAFLRVRSEWKPSGPRETIVLLLAILGLFVLFPIARAAAVSVLAILAACTLAVAVTWSAEGRFLVPVLPLLAALAAVGMWFVVVALESRSLDGLRTDALEAGPV